MIGWVDSAAHTSQCKCDKHRNGDIFIKGYAVDLRVRHSDWLECYQLQLSTNPNAEWGDLRNVQIFIPKIRKLLFLSHHNEICRDMKQIMHL